MARPPRCTLLHHRDQPLRRSLRRSARELPSHDERRRHARTHHPARRILHQPLQVRRPYARRLKPGPLVRHRSADTTLCLVAVRELRLFRARAAARPLRAQPRVPQGACCKRALPGGKPRRELVRYLGGPAERRLCAHIQGGRRGNEARGGGDWGPLGVGRERWWGDGGAACVTIGFGAGGAAGRHPAPV